METEATLTVYAPAGDPYWSLKLCGRMGSAASSRAGDPLKSLPFPLDSRKSPFLLRVLVQLARPFWALKTPAPAGWLSRPNKSPPRRGSARPLLPPPRPRPLEAKGHEGPTSAGGASTRALSFLPHLLVSPPSRYGGVAGSRRPGRDWVQANPQFLIRALSRPRHPAAGGVGVER